MPESPALEIWSLKVKHMLRHHSVAGSPEGGVTSAIDPDFKRNRLPAGSIVRGQCPAFVWTHISLSQLNSPQSSPNAAVLKTWDFLILLQILDITEAFVCCNNIDFDAVLSFCLVQDTLWYLFFMQEVEI